MAQQQQEGGRNHSLSLQHENNAYEFIHVLQSHVEIFSARPQSPWPLPSWFLPPKLMCLSKSTRLPTHSMPILTSSPTTPVPQPTSQPMSTQSSSASIQPFNTSVQPLNMNIPYGNTSTLPANTNTQPLTLNDQLANASARLASAQRMSTCIQSASTNARLENANARLESANARLESVYEHMRASAQVESAQDQTSRLLSAEISPRGHALRNALVCFYSNLIETRKWTKEECIQVGIVFDHVKEPEGCFCPILQDTLAEGQPVAFWPTCRHSFDPDSLVAYLGKTCNPPTCPVCRIPLNMNASKTDDRVVVSSTSTTPSINTFQNQDAQSSSETSSSASVPSTSWYNTTLTRPMVVNSSTHPRASQQQQQQPVPSNRQAQRRQCCVVL